MSHLVLYLPDSASNSYTYISTATYRVLTTQPPNTRPLPMSATTEELAAKVERGTMTPNDANVLNSIDSIRVSNSHSEGNDSLSEFSDCDIFNCSDSSIDISLWDESEIKSIIDSLCGSLEVNNYWLTRQSVLPKKRASSVVYDVI
jgi:hypothetical protein